MNNYRIFSDAPLISPELFVGRQAELSHLQEWGRRGGLPLMVVGPTGIGKTSLVLKYAHMSRSDYARQFILHGRMFESPNSILPFIASRLGQSPHYKQYSWDDPDPTGLLSELSNGQFSGQRILVILDGLDELPSPQAELPDFVARLGENRSETRWLLTSRSGYLGPLSRPRDLIPIADLEVLRLRGFNGTEVREFLEKRLRFAGYEDIQKLRQLRNITVHQLGGNPFFMNLIGNFISEHADLDLDKTILDITTRLVKGFTNLLLVLTRGRLTAIPVTQLSTQQVITPKAIVVPTAPYVIIPRLSLFWKKQLEEFEELMNDPSKKEHDYQAFFERNPHFLKGIKYERVIPQPILKREEEEGNLKPDFFLQPLGSQYADILDLKLPTRKLIVGSRDRLHFSASVNKAVAQVREYRDYFEDSQRRRLVADKYGLTAYRPSVAVIIGRTPEYLGEEKLKQILESTPGYTKIITYDQLLSRMRRLVDMYGV